MGRMLATGRRSLGPRQEPKAGILPQRMAPVMAAAGGVQPVLGPRQEPGWKMEGADYNMVRTLGFLFALGFLFVRFSHISEGVMAIAGIPTYLNYFTFFPAILMLVLSGGLKRSLSYRAAVFILLFAFWMTLAVFPSHWPGGSFGRAKSYWQFEVPILLLIGGLALNWNDVKKIFAALAWSGIVILILVRLKGRVDQGRLSLDFPGSIANANDLASHLLMLMPFFLYMMIDRKRMFILRVMFGLAIPYTFYLILSTASRGALVAIACGVVFALVYASMSQRLAFLLIVPILAAATVVMLPERTLGRLGTLTGSTQDLEGEESGRSRRYLFEQSVIFTLQKPIFGVGPDQFANYEGGTRVKEGKTGNWHETHCSWTQVSSECGIPALIFYAGAVWMTFSRTRQGWKKARQMRWREGINMYFCFQLSMVMFFASITFLSNAYTYRQPAMVAIGFAMSMALGRVVSAQEGRTAVAPAVAKAL